MSHLQDRQNGAVAASADSRRTTPATDRLLHEPRIAAAVERLGRTTVKQVIAAAQDSCRRGELDPAAAVEAVLASLPAAPTSMREVVNATGVVLHTNLGRAPLSSAAREAVRQAAGYTDIELDLAAGRRTRRGGGALDALAAAVPDAEAVHVVNNGAAALALVGRLLATDRDIVIARGELVEIGAGFRIPELLESVGCRLREVGTTNRVRLDDYAEAIDDQTGFVLKVHPSNFVVDGFTSAVPVADLAGLPVPVVSDIGSGLLAPHPRLPEEPNAATELRAGAALVTASGDKLLGGPQCGLLLGRAELIARLRRHPLARAVRVDKLTLAALEATLTGPPAPTATALGREGVELMSRAQAIVEAIRRTVPAAVEVSAASSAAAVGGGGAPGVELASAAVVLPPSLAAPLRVGQPPIVGRVEEGRLLLDLIAVDPGLDADLVRAVVSLIDADPALVRR